MKPYLAKVLAIVVKDMVTEMRTREVLTSMLVFALLVAVTFSFAFELRLQGSESAVSGALWVAIAFAGMLGLNRSFIVERDRGSLEGLLLCPVDRSALYLGKMLGNLLFMIATEALLLPLFAVLFDQPILEPRLLVVVLLGTIGLAAVGTLFSAVAVHTRAREVMLPVLLLPVAIPVLIAGVKATGESLARTPPSMVGPWMEMLIGFDVVFLAVALLTFEYVFQE